MKTSTSTTLDAKGRAVKVTKTQTTLKPCPFCGSDAGVGAKNAIVPVCS